MTSRLFQETVTKAKARNLGRKFNRSFAKRRRSRAAAVASSSMVSIDGHPFAAAGIGDAPVTAVENIGRPAAAVYRGDAVDGTIVIAASGGGSTSAAGGGDTGGGGDTTPAVTHHPDLTGLLVANQHSIAVTTGLQAALDERSVWSGNWAAGQYQAQEWVRDGAYLLIANDQTQERPAPQALGAAYNAYSGSSPTTSVSSKQLLTGIQLTPATLPHLLVGYRIYTDTGVTYYVYTVDNAGVINWVVFFTAALDGWQRFAIDPIIVQPGETFALYTLAVEPDSSPTVWQATYNYRTPNASATPAAGEIIHANDARDEFRIHKTDDFANDRSTNLGAMVVGDIIAGAGQRWTIQAITDNTTWMNFEVAPASQGMPNGQQLFDFETATAKSVTYVSDTNHWSGNSEVAGLYGVNVPYSSVTPDDNQYGVDLELQQVAFSSDWDLIGHIGGGINAGPGGGALHDPVTSPLGTIDVGGVGGQEIDLNQDYAYVFTAGITFENSPLIQQANPALTFNSTTSGNDWSIGFLGSSDRFRLRYEDTTIMRFDMASYGLIQVTDLDINADVVIDGNTEITGALDVDSIVSSTSITVQPTNDINLWPADDVTMNGIQRWEDWYTSPDTGVFIDWSGTLGSYMPLLEVAELVVQTFTVRSAEVSVGQHIVGKSASQTTRDFTIPTVGNQGTIYIKNVPGVDDMAAFSVGDDLVFRYWCETGGNAPNIAEVEGYWSDFIYESGGGGSGSTIEDEDFDTTTLGSVPADWNPTGPNNSMTTDNDAWGAYDDTGIDPTRMMQTQGAIGEDANVHLHFDGTGYATLADYRYTGRFYKNAYSSGVGLTVLSDYPSSDTYIRVRAYNNSTMHVAVHGYSDPTGGVTDSGYTPPVGSWVQFKIEVEDDGSSRTTFRAKFWADGGTEPGSWQIDCYWDGASRPTEGTFGMWGYQNSGTAFACYDDIFVENLGATANTPQLDIDINITSDTDYVTAIILASWDPAEATPTLTADTGFSSNDTIAMVYSTIDGNYCYGWIYEKYSGLTAGTLSTTWATNRGGLAVLLITHKNVSATSATAGTKSPRLGEAWTGIDPGVLYDNRHEFEISIQNSPGPVSVIGAHNLAAQAALGNEMVIRVNQFPWKGVQKETLAYEFDREMAGTIFNYYIPATMGTGTWAQYGLAYAKVISRQTPGDLEDDEQAWTIEMTRGPSGSCVLSPNAGIFDLGVEGDSFWIADATDPLSGGAYDAVIRRNADPWDWTPRIRTGYLSGTGASGEVGLYFLDGTAEMELSNAVAYMRDIEQQIADPYGRLVYSLQKKVYTGSGKRGPVIHIEDLDFTNYQSGYSFGRHRPNASDPNAWYDYAGLYSWYNVATDEYHLSLANRIQNYADGAEAHIEIVSENFQAAQASITIEAVNTTDVARITLDADSAGVATLEAESFTFDRYSGASSTGSGWSVDTGGNVNHTDTGLVSHRMIRQSELAAGNAMTRIDFAGLISGFSDYETGARIQATATETWAHSGGTPTDIGTDLRFYTTDNNTTSLSERVRFDYDGRVGIGQTSPSAMLDVLAAETGFNGLRVEMPSGTTGDALQIRFNGSAYLDFIADAGQSLYNQFANDFGNDVAGPQLRIGRNSSSGTEGGAAGSIRLAAGDNGLNYLWVDTSGDFRIHSAAPTGSSGTPTVADTAGTIVGTQSSLRSAKSIEGPGIAPADALQKVLDASVYAFRYKRNAGDAHNGVMADEFPEVMYDAGRSFSPVDGFGILVQTTKALYDEIERLRAEIETLRRH